MNIPKIKFSSNNNININIFENILDSMHDWVRVIDLNDNIIYVNKAMAKALNENPIGKKCYKAFERDIPCEKCVSRATIATGQPQQQEELIHNRTFSVMSSPIKDKDGNIIAVVEVLRDITEMKKLQKAIINQNKKLKSELNIAKKLQYSLLPKEIPNDNIEFSYIYKPCDTLGGDFLDIFKIDTSHIGVYIADVSGHGVAASMLTVFLRSSIDKTIISPASALKKLYIEFNNNFSDQDLYITIFYAIFDITSNTLVYSNAGLNVSPILLNPYTKTFKLLRVPGIPISNWVENPSYEDKKLILQNRDKLFLYTDGIVELKNNKNEQFGENRLIGVLQGNVESPGVILDRIIKAASEFAGIERYNNAADDITMALLEIKNSKD